METDLWGGDTAAGSTGCKALHRSQAPRHDRLCISGFINLKKKHEQGAAEGSVKWNTNYMVRKSRQKTAAHDTFRGKRRKDHEPFLYLCTVPWPGRINWVGREKATAQWASLVKPHVDISPTAQGLLSGKEAGGTNWKTWNSIKTWENPFLLWWWLRTGAGCPESLRSLPLWGCSRREMVLSKLL